MRVRSVPVLNLKDAMKEEWVDHSRRPFVSSGNAYIPVKNGFDADTNIEERSRYCGIKYQMIGDIALIHGELPSEEELKSLINWVHPRGVVLIYGYDGIKRIPKSELLYGESKEVCHKEIGCKFWIDPVKVMFSKGNREEKKRMAKIVRPGERVADMFAGIGYFTIPFAKSGAYIHSMEINPDSYYFLKKNVSANNLEEFILAEQGDCRKLLKGEYDRAVMGHFDSPNMLPDILSHMNSGGVLHVHSINPVSEEIIRQAETFGFNADIKINKVKKYAPGRWHIVSDVVLS
ncbi:SAM-dependent methyltransferase [Methanoplanus sp. FWC-SCC4]|uniref:SAM-dependent methyltransferase n=1 Tax=Methanochimaera problematica TaxID=2609417 RepID=A0AA97FDP0_9EURY|nr:SAM-dependent methyltransferase [Methanoplanus sp. FWC-SCC4]WOF16324.1 SAM-dependent methyltransferase [Methanoplanus sp. FWC-SCC4]